MTKAKKPQSAKAAVERRDVLKLIGLGGAGAAAAVAPVVVTPAEARENRDTRARARYRDTEHVQTYYRTNRY